MPPPRVAVRLADVRTDLRQLLTWRQTSPGSNYWVERLNELRLVRATLAWEDFLEETFLCYLRGSRGVSGTTYALVGQPAATFATAQALVLNGAPYGNWLNEKWVDDRARQLFFGPHPFLVLASPPFQDLRVVRNRIVHRSEVAKAAFRAVVTANYGVVKRGMTPGRFLSESVQGSSRIERYIHALDQAAQLIAQ